MFFIEHDAHTDPLCAVTIIRAWWRRLSAKCGHVYLCMTAMFIRDVRPRLFVHDGDIYP
jgi:hypothetical protein